MKSDSGFSLLELMITLVIAGILMATGIPAMSDMLRNNRIAGQANELLTSLAAARGEAIKRGVPVVVCRSTESATPTCGSGAGWQAGWAIFADNNADGAFSGGNEQVIAIRPALTGNNTVAASTSLANRVIFTPQGVVGAGGVGNFVISDSRGAPKGVRLICLAMTGRARVFNDGTVVCPP